MNLLKVLLIKPDIEYPCIVVFRGDIEIGFVRRHERGKDRSVFYFDDNIELFTYYDNQVSYLHHNLDDIVFLGSVYDIMNGVKVGKQCVKYITNIFMTHNNTQIGLSYLAVDWYKDYPVLMQWALKLVHDNIVTDITTLKYFISFKKDNGHLSQFLQKKTLTAYNTEEDIINLINEIKSIKRNKKSLSIIKQFNTQQRALLSNISFTKEQSLLLFKFDILDKDLKINFIKKVSNVSDVEVFFELLSLFTKDSYSWDYNDFTKYIGNKDKLNLKFDVVHSNEQNKVYILKVYDYNTMRELGAQTSWCISKYDSSWDEYCNNGNNQYIFYDFKQKENHIKSMFGFTLNEKNNFVLHAHDFNNRKSILYYRDKDMPFTYETNYDFEDVLDENGVRLHDILNIKNEFNFEWNYNSMMNYLKECSFPLFTVKYNEEKNTCLIKIIRNSGSNYNIEKFAKNLPLFERYFYEVNYFDDYDYTTWGYLVFDFNKPITDNMSAVCLYCYNDGKINDLFFYGAHDINGKYLNIKGREYLHEKGLYSILMNIDSPANQLFQHVLYSERNEAIKLINTTSPSEFHKVECGICTGYDSMFYILTYKKWFNVIKLLIQNGAYINMSSDVLNIINNILEAFSSLNEKESDNYDLYFSEISSMFTMIYNDVYKRGMVKEFNDIATNLIINNSKFMNVILSNENFFDCELYDRHHGYSRYFAVENVWMNIFTKLLAIENCDILEEWLNIDEKNGKSTINVTPSVVMIYECKMYYYKNLNSRSQEIFNKINEIILKGKEKLIKEDPSLEEVFQYNLKSFIEKEENKVLNACIKKRSSYE